MEVPVASPAMPPESLLQHRDFVEALARRLVFDRDRADDIVQQTWLAAIQNPPRRAGVRAWLATVTRNYAKKQRRTDRRRERHERAAASGAPSDRGVPTPAQILERERTRREVVDAVLALDEPYRDVVVLRYFEHLTPTEIAARLDAPVDTVKTRLKRAIHRLRGSLDDRFGDRSTWATALVPLMGLKLPPAAAASASAAAIASANAASTATGLLLMSAKAQILVAIALVAGVAVTVLQVVQASSPAPDDDATASASAPVGTPDQPPPSSPRAERQAAPAIVESPDPKPVPVTTEPEPSKPTESPAEYLRRLELAATSFRGDQPDYIAWLSLMNDLADHATLDEASIYVDERGRKIGRFELPGELQLRFEIDGNERKLELQNMKSMLPAGSAFSDLEGKFGFHVGEQGIERAFAQVHFDDFSYQGLEPQILGHLVSVNAFTTRLTPATQRKNPDEDDSWIHELGEPREVPFSDLRGARRWHEILSRLPK